MTIRLWSLWGVVKTALGSWSTSWIGAEAAAPKWLSAAVRLRWSSARSPL